jgi:hypothetical protein
MTEVDLKDLSPVDRDRISKARVAAELLRATIESLSKVDAVPNTLPDGSPVLSPWLLTKGKISLADHKKHGDDVEREIAEYEKSYAVAYAEDRKRLAASPTLPSDRIFVDTQRLKDQYRARALWGSRSVGGRRISGVPVSFVVPGGDATRTLTFADSPAADPTPEFFQYAGERLAIIRKSLRRRISSEGEPREVDSLREKTEKASASLVEAQAELNSAMRTEWNLPRAARAKSVETAAAAAAEARAKRNMLQNKLEEFQIELRKWGIE